MLNGLRPPASLGEDALLRPCLLGMDRTSRWK